MRQTKKPRFLLHFAFPLFAVMTTVLLTTVAFGETSNGNYVKPGAVVDFTDIENVYNCTGITNVVLSPTDEGMKVSFLETDSGSCVDPYFSLPLPEKTVNCKDLPYMALLVKTDKQDLMGQIRFRTTAVTKTYPCQLFTYEKTEDWQLIVCDLTDMSTVKYHDGTAFTGNYTNFRLDMYDNRCPVDTSYIIKAYALYDNLEDAMTFINYESPTFTKDNDTLPNIDFSSFWRGEAFAKPDSSERILWVDSGFNEAYLYDLEKFVAQGFGGIVSNVPFNQQYLKDESEFALLREVYKTAVEKDMHVWIYDEYHWPSGKAFGQVLDGHDEYEATGIRHKTLSGYGGSVSYALKDREIRVMEAVLTDKNGSRTLTIEGDTFNHVNAEGRWTLDLYILGYTHSGEEDRTNFHSLRDVDLLNKGAVARFIELTHEHYKTAFGEDFSLVEAFFTDEPQLGNRDDADYAVWTNGFDTLFKQTYGYDLPIHAIFKGNDDASRLARMQYYALVSDLFKESYIDQITDWCVANGVDSSGHLLFEENMNDHIETYGGNFLQIVGGMTVPGADILWADPAHLMSNGNVGSYMGQRYVTSAAKNAGRDRVMIEYNPSACRTEEFSKDKMGSSIGGITLTRLFGTTEYTMINAQKDYSVAQSNILNTYVGRLNTLLDGTTERCDVGIFYPIATVQALHDADSVHSSTYGSGTEAIELNTNYARLCKGLLTNRVLYTVIDDESICSAEVTCDGRLVIGNGAYRIMILAYADYISAEAAEKLAAFCKAGGTVLFFDGAPTKSLDGKSDDRVAAAMTSMSNQPTYKSSRLAKLYADVVGMCNNILSLDTCKGVNKSSVLYGDFEDDSHTVSYLANIVAEDATLTLSFRDGYDGAYTVYYPNSGNIESGSGNTVNVTVPGYEAVLVVREGNTTDIPETAETSGDAASETTANDEKKGCGSALSTSFLGLLGICAACMMCGKKKENA